MPIIDFDPDEYGSGKYDRETFIFLGLSAQAMNETHDIISECHTMFPNIS